MCGSSPRILAAAWVDSSASRVRSCSSPAYGNIWRNEQICSPLTLSSAAHRRWRYPLLLPVRSANGSRHNPPHIAPASCKLPPVGHNADHSTHQATSLRHKSVARLPASVVGLFNCPNCAPVIRRQPLPAGTDTASYAPSYTGYKQP